VSGNAIILVIFEVSIDALIVVKSNPLSSHHKNNVCISCSNVEMAAIVLSGVVAMASLIKRIPS
jgi:hypothetical protein